MSRDYRTGYVSQFWTEDIDNKPEDERWSRYETMLESKDWFYDLHESAACFEAGLIQNEIIDRLRTQLSEIDKERADALYEKHMPELLKGS